MCYNLSISCKSTFTTIKIYNLILLLNINGSQKSLLSYSSASEPFSIRAILFLAYKVQCMPVLVSDILTSQDKIGGKPNAIKTDVRSHLFI